MEYGELLMEAYYIDKNGNLKFSLFCNVPKLPRKLRGKCGAKTRKSASCQAPPVWSKWTDKARNGRCKLHGGLSTGPRTEAGREAIRASNRRRRKLFVATKLAQDI